MRIVLAALLLSLLECKRSAPPAPAPVLVVSAPPEIAAVDARRAVLDAWNDAHASRNATALEPLYAGRVFFYGTVLSPHDCADRNAKLFAKTPDYTQRVRDVKIEADDAGTHARMAFIKTVTANGKTNDYPSYLGLDRSSGTWLVSEESDTITDANLAKLAAKRPKPKACSAAIAAALGDLWDNRVNGSTFGFDEYVICGDNQCANRHAMVVDSPATGAGHAPRMIGIEVELSSGIVTSTGDGRCSKTAGTS